MHGSEHSEEEFVYVTVKLINLAGVELATVRVDKDATIGQLVAKMKLEPSLPVVARCLIVFDDDTGQNAYDLSTHASRFIKCTLTAWCKNLSEVRCRVIESVEPTKS